MEVTTLTPPLRFFFSEPPRAGARPAIFLDRDGVINDKIENGYVTCWADFQFVPGIVETLRALATNDLPIVVISNQAAVEKGILTRRNIEDITERFAASVQA